MANPEKCPGCGAAAARRYEGHTWYECGAMWGATDHFLDVKNCLERQLAQEKAKNERLREALAQTVAALHYPENGHHSCRWCDACTSNGWQHDPYCVYVAHCKEIDDAKAAAAATDKPADAAPTDEAPQRDAPGGEGE